MAEIRARIAGEDQMHRSLAQEALEREALRTGDVLLYEGIDRGGDFFTAKGVRERLRQRLNLPPHKPLFFSDVGALRGHPDAVGMVDVVRLSECDGGEGHLIVLLADTDGKPERIAAAEAARRWFTEKPRKAAALIVGTPHRDAEAWVVAGLIDDEDGPLLSQRRKAARLLTFDPCASPERLTSAPNDADTDAKRVLCFLLGDEDHLRHTPSRPPAPDTHAELLDRAFIGWHRLIRTDAAQETLLAPFVEAIKVAVKDAAKREAR